MEDLEILAKNAIEFGFDLVAVNPIAKTFISKHKSPNKEVTYPVFSYEIDNNTVVGVAELGEYLDLSSAWASGSFRP